MSLALLAAQEDVMISKRSANSLSLMVVLAALLGCKLFDESPKKVCAKLDALKAEEGVSDSDPEPCEQRLARTKKDDLQAFECMAKCVKRAESSSSAESCWQQSCASSSGSESESASETESNDDKLARMAIDRLDDSRVNGRTDLTACQPPRVLQ